MIVLEINLRPVDHILNIRDEDSVVNKSKIKSLERKNLTIYWNTFGVDLKKFQFRLTYFGEE